MKIAFLYVYHPDESSEGCIHDVLVFYLAVQYIINTELNMSLNK